MASALQLRSFCCTSESRSVCGWKTSSPDARASALTSLLDTFMPRPAGRSGRVSTSTTSWPAARSACNEAAANAGVPANTRRMAASERHALLLLHLGGDAGLLEPRQVFDEDLALEVVHLMLDAHRQQPGCLARERFA